MPTFNILIVDDERIIRESLANYLFKYHNIEYELSIDSANDCQSAIAFLEKVQYHLVVADIILPDGSGFDIVDKINKFYPETKVVLITAHKTEDYFKIAIEKNISNIIVKTAPFNFNEFSSVVNAALLPNKYLFDIHNYLLKDRTIKHFTIDNYSSITTIQTIIKKCMEYLNIQNTELISIALLEAITNALYYTGSSIKRYEKLSDQKLLKNQEIEIKYGWDSEKFAVSVEDKAGKLSKKEVMYWLERNMTGDGVLDTHGRGFYLMHCIVDRLIININKNIKTELIFIIYLNNNYAGHKPININEI